MDEPPQAGACATGFAPAASSRYTAGGRKPSHLPPIIAAQGLSKRFGAEPLFQNISFTLSEGERIGLIGPNGSGKSTLLEILRGRVAPDTGEVAIRRGVRLASAAQNSEFPAGATVRSVIEGGLDRAGVPESQRAS